MKLKDLLNDIKASGYDWDTPTQEYQFEFIRIVEHSEADKLDSFVRLELGSFKINRDDKTIQFMLE